MAPQRSATETLRSSRYSITSSASASRSGGISAQRLCGLDVERDLEFDRRLRRQIARLGALQDPVDIGGGAEEDVGGIGAI